MPKLQHKYDVENPKVMENNGLLPLHQSTMTSGQDSYITIPAQNVKSTLLGSGSVYNLDIEPDEVGRVDDICFRFTITCSNADVECVNPAYWCSRIILEPEKGSQSEIIHIYPENIVVWDWLTKDRIGREQSKWLCNYDYTENKSENSNRYCVSERTKFKAGETRDIYIKLPALFLYLNALDFKQIRSDFRFRFEFATESNFLISGDRNNLSIDSINTIIRTFSEENYDYQHRMNKLQQHNNKYIYLDHERLVYNDKTLTAGTTARFDLSQFVGKCPFLMVVIKPNSSPNAADQSIFNFQEIGINGTFDLTNSSSQSLLGNGTAIKQNIIYSIFSEQTGNPHLQGVYFIPFCENIKKSVAGNLNGLFQFVGLKDYLEITFDSANVSEVHTISTDALGTTGTYRYAFENGIISSQELDYDDTASDIQTAINSIPQLKEKNISVSVNNGLDATTSQTITYNAGSGQVSEDLGKITILGNNTPKVNSTTISTQGKKGWTTGSNYTVEIFMYKFKCLEVSKSGRFTCKDL